MQWNVTAQVADLLSGVNHGFVIRDAAEQDERGGDHGYHSREKGDNPPELVVHFAAPPSGEPGPPEPPEPAVVSCGQILGRSTLVLNDLSNCPADGLVIGSSRIIVDLDMPGLDGIELCRRLRADDRTREVPVLAVTGYDDRRYPDRIIQAGANHVLLKPLEAGVLLAEMHRLLTKT